MTNTITARANSYDIDKLLDFEESLPDPKRCMYLITVAMQKYNKSVRDSSREEKQNTSWISTLFEKITGDKRIQPYLGKTYNSERDFCKDFDEGKIYIDDNRDLLDLYYRTQDLFKVRKIANCAKLGDRVVFGTEFDLKALKRVISRPDIYINLYEDNDYYFDEDY